MTKACYVTLENFWSQNDRKPILKTWPDGTEPWGIRSASRLRTTPRILEAWVPSCYNSIYWDSLLWASFGLCCLNLSVITPPLRVIGISCTKDMPRQPRVTLTDITNTSTSDQAGAVDAAAPRRQERNKQQRKRRSEMSDEQREEINRKQHEYRARKKGRVKPHLPYRRPHSNHDILHIGSSESKPFCQSTVWVHE